jgi:hypothetical protein
MLVSVNLLPASAPSGSDEIDFNAIDRYITDKVRTSRIPGVALVIVKDDQIACLKAYGQPDSSGRAVHSKLLSSALGAWISTTRIRLRQTCDNITAKVAVIGGNTWTRWRLQPVTNVSKSYEP